MRLNRSTVLITGASEGIGRATAKLFATRGCHVIAAARTGTRLESLAEEIHAEGTGSCEPLLIDVSDAEGTVDKLGSIAEEKDISIAIINAGVGQYGPFAQTPWSDVAPLLRVNIDGAMAATRAVIPSMIAKRRGSVVLISSTIGKRAVPYNAAYCASKYALQGFSEALRLELRPFGVHLGVVCPARTDTAFFNSMTFSVPQRSSRKVPTSDPLRVARAILRCVERRRREIVVSPEGKLYTFVGTHFPRLTDAILYHSVPRPTEP
ncbi:SDR family NAD(P)-dependent oxidoreductase [bacterium]|nr:SDR family NAD(P)-dependent oxidoreductase [bacterium]